MYQEQLSTLHDVAAQYWQKDPGQLTDAFNAIEVIKHNPGKVVGFLPSVDNFPPVFFKVYFNNAFQYELNGLQTTMTMPKVPGISTSPILQIIPEHKAILTEKMDWDDTTTPIKRFFVGSLGIDWQTVGRWLRAFHDTQVTHTRNEKFIRRKFEKFDSHLHDLQSLFTPKQITRMKAIGLDARDYYESTDMEWVISHGDFGLDNIKKSKNDLFVIDFEDCQLAPREFDILNCLVRMDYMNWFPHRRGSYEEICKQFERGYGREMKPSPVYDFLYLLVKLDMLETYYRRKTNLVKNQFSKLVYKIFNLRNIYHLRSWLIIDR